MKNTKKILSVILSLLLVIGMMSTFAFAEEAATPNNSTVNANKGKITIDASSVQAGKEYSIYKIFDVTYDKTDGKSNYSYTISSESEWYNTVNSYADGKDSGMTLKAIAGKTTYYTVTVDEDKFSAAKFASTLYTALTNEGSSITKADGNNTKTASEGSAVEFSNLALGYYFVTSGAGAVCNLTTTDPEVTIFDKNKKPDIDKTAKIEGGSAATADLGKVIDYTIDGKLPSTTGYDSYTYNIADTMTSGLTLDKSSLKVTIGTEEYKATESDGTWKLMKEVGEGETSSELTSSELTYTDYSAYSAEKNQTDGFTIKLDLVQLGKPANTEIKVTYSAKVNERAIKNAVEKNKVELVYSNDPEKGGTGTYTPPEVVTKVFNIAIDKVNASSNKLEGAKFILKKIVDKTDIYYKLENNVVSWVNDVKDATAKVTDKDGKATFEGLAAGTYYLVETEAPDGYNILSEPVKVYINDEGKVTIDDNNSHKVTNDDGTTSDVDYEVSENDASITVTIENYTGTELPETGGIGTTIFYIAGAILVIGAGVVFVTRRRMHSDN